MKIDNFLTKDRLNMLTDILKVVAVLLCLYLVFSFYANPIFTITLLSLVSLHELIHTKKSKNTALELVKEFLSDYKNIVHLLIIICHLASFLYNPMSHLMIFLLVINCIFAYNEYCKSPKNLSSTLMILALPIFILARSIPMVNVILIVFCGPFINLVANMVLTFNLIAYYFKEQIEEVKNKISLFSQMLKIDGIINQVFSCSAELNTKSEQANSKQHDFDSTDTRVYFDI